MSAKQSTKDAALAEEYPPARLLDEVRDDWWLDARCRVEQIPTDIFYPERAAPNSARPARRLCAPCPVRSECLTWAIRNDEHEGIWGGLSPRARVTVARKAGLA